eukprot:TRINITY_DN25599_c0_g1_i1.p1 TRINITY_DN25599_c0_g1~~TRINITY_DN25599_c0_g1_i1.p1  ORF type:complete len:129 (-),score=23.69 TRINITY_DN25599_c0_g1_i1:11-397(-)
MRRKLVVISGMTGVGKSKLTARLINQINGEIINGDALQIYKNFRVASNIGNEYNSSRPRLLGAYNLFEERINAVTFKTLVEKEIEDIYSQNKQPVIEGGSAFYLNNFCLLYTSPSPRDRQKSRMPSSA